MGIVVDLALFVFGAVTSPVWLFSLWRKGKLRTDWLARFAISVPKLGDPGRVSADSRRRPRILIHAVSVGEVNSVRLLVEMLASAPLNAQVVVSVTTDTGIARAKSLFGAKHVVVRYPLDFSWSVRRFLSAVKPDLTLLTELEVWPNFTRACAAMQIPVAVINGRLSSRSFARTARVHWLLSPMFRRLSHVAAQDQVYADRFAAMGIATDRISVTGTMKWDTAEIATQVEGANELAAELGIEKGKPLVVAGSTAPGEEQLISNACPSGVQVLCAPRKPEWFDQAAGDLRGCVRRSSGAVGSSTGRFLLDTIGELRKAYALADVVVVGRTFGALHGSDMMEPAALGKPVVVGPRVGDFQATADALLKCGGLIQTTAQELPVVIAELLADAPRRRAIANAAREEIRKQQGASRKHADLAAQLLKGKGFGAVGNV